MAGDRSDIATSEAHPALSVIICSLGNAQLERAVDSVVASAKKASAHVEIIVVWQGRKEHPALGAGVRILETIPVGLAYARNRGLAVARAALIGFVDDDEVVDKGWVAAALAALSGEGDMVAAFGPVQPLDEDGLPHCLLDPGEPRLFTRSSTPPWVVGTGGNMIIRRDVLEEEGGFDPKLGAGAEGRAGEESDLIVRLLRHGNVLVWSPALTVYHPTKTPDERLASRFPYGFGLGRVVRRHMAPMLAARYVRATLQYLREGLRKRDSQQRREALQTLRGFFAGVFLPVRPMSPTTIGEYAPGELRGEVSKGRLEPLRIEYGETPRLRYRLCDGRLLDVYLAPPRTLVESLGRSEAEQAVVPGRDSVWLLRGRSSIKRRPSVHV
jgi:GT2 family glycosyltransferase